MPGHVFEGQLADPRQLAELLRQHGARDKLPDWNRHCDLPSGDRIFNANFLYGDE